MQGVEGFTEGVGTGAVELDVDEHRDLPSPHRYVHGGFAGTATRFAIAMPDAWDGRMLQFLQGGMGGSEHQGQQYGGLELAFGLGAVHVESNQGHVGNDLSGLGGDMAILAWKASAATAVVAHHMIAEHYERELRASIVFGPSGGGMRSMDCLRARPDLWDGALPFMINRAGLMMCSWSVAAWATLLLGPDARRLEEAVRRDPDCDIGDLLSDEARTAAAMTLLRCGYPSGALVELSEDPVWLLGMNLAFTADRTYVEDFWTKPGYAGADGDPLLLAGHVAGQATVRRVLTVREVDAVGGDLSRMARQMVGRLDDDDPIALELDLPGDIGIDRLFGATLTLRDARSMICTGTVGPGVGALLDPVGLRGVKPGDTVSYDNRGYLAFSHLHRHLATDRYPETAHLADTTPAPPLRALTVSVVAPRPQPLPGKVILMQHLNDREAWPGAAVHLVEDLQTATEGDLSEAFRLYWVEAAAHFVPIDAAERLLLIDYGGYTMQGLEHLLAWVEDDVAPPPSTAFTMTDDQQVALPQTAAARAGLQPVIEGIEVPADVVAGHPFRARVRVTLPHAAGVLRRVEWDVDGSGSFKDRLDLDGTEAEVELECVFADPGRSTMTVRVVAAGVSHPASRRYERTNLRRVAVDVAAGDGLPV